MNSSANTSDEHGDPNWATVNWDQSGAICSLDQAARQYTTNRLDWEWDSMILAQHPGSGGSNDCSDADCKNHIAAAGTMSNLRTFNMLSALPPKFTQTSMGIYNSAGMRNYGALETMRNLPSTSTIQNVHRGSSGIPGLAPTARAGLHCDLQSSFDEQRCRDFYAGMQQNQYVVKREDEIHHYTGVSMNGGRTQQNVHDGHGARLGLNLGGRTYFSTDDIAVGRQGKRHRAGSPGLQVPICQAEGCKSDLSTAKHYHRRHKVCSFHSKAPNVVVAGRVQRFCQQCSRFHFLLEFDEGKRSCRKRLADHNRRRRKPLLSALTCDPAVESIGMKGGEDSNLSGSRATDSKSMLLHLKKCRSPSTVSLKDSDEQPASAKNNLHLHNPGATFGRVPKEDQHSSQPGMQMSSQPVSGPQAQAKLVSAMSLSLLSPCNATTHQLSIMPGNANHSQDATVHQQYLQGVNPNQSGPSLSLSPLGGPGHQPGTCGQPMPGETYNGMDAPVPWLRNITSQGSDLGQVVGRPGGLNLQHLLSTDSKAGQSPHQSVTTATVNSNSQAPDAQIFSASDQNLCPCPLQTSSGDIAGPEWMLGSMTGQPNPSGEPNDFGPSCSLTSLSGSGQLEGQQMLALLETSALRPGQCENLSGSGNVQHVQDRSTPMEFLQQHKNGTESCKDHSNQTLRSTGSPDLKYVELHAVRPYEPSSSIYDSHQILFRSQSSYNSMV